MLVEPGPGESWKDAIQRALDTGHAILPAELMDASSLSVTDGCVIEALPGARVVGDPIFETAGLLKRVSVSGGTWEGLTWRHRGVLSYSVFDRMFLRGRAGFRLNGAVGCLWRRIECADLSTGFQLGEDDAVNQNVWRNCRWVRGRVGMLLEGPGPIKRNHLDSCWFENMEKSGLRVGSLAQDITVRRSWFEDIPTPIDDPVQAISVADTEIV